MPIARETRVLVISGEPIGERRAGPAVRALAMTQEISLVAEARLLSTATNERSHVDGREVFSRRDVRGMVAWADVIVFQGYFLTEFPWVVNRGKILVSDLYAPFHLEHLLEGSHSDIEDSYSEYSQTVASLNWQLRHADFFLAASSKQRDFWLGHLAAMGRINPSTLYAGKDFTHLIDIVPFGIDEKEPSPNQLLLRSHINASPDDKIVIWGGGIYEWFDPLTLIEAMGQLQSTNPEIKLFFMATQHPNSSVTESPIIEETIKRASALGVLEKTVFFNQQWIPFENRAAYLCDADLGISIHGSHIETAFSFRTRMLDYIWAGLPIVTSDGDSFADMVSADQLGVVVPVRNATAIAEAMIKVLDEPAQHDIYSSNIILARQGLYWSKVLKPLVDFCISPHRAADFQVDTEVVLKQPRKPQSWANVVTSTYRKVGFSGLIHKVFKKLRG